MLLVVVAVAFFAVLGTVLGSDSESADEVAEGGALPDSTWWFVEIDRQPMEYLVHGVAFTEVSSSRDRIELVGCSGASGLAIPDRDGFVVSEFDWSDGDCLSEFDESAPQLPELFRPGRAVAVEIDANGCLLMEAAGVEVRGVHWYSRSVNDPSVDLGREPTADEAAMVAACRTVPPG